MEKEKTRCPGTGGGTRIQTAKTSEGRTRGVGRRRESEGRWRKWNRTPDLTGVQGDLRENVESLSSFEGSTRVGTERGPGEGTTLPEKGDTQRSRTVGGRLVVGSRSSHGVGPDTRTSCGSHHSSPVYRGTRGRASRSPEVLNMLLTS